MNIRSITAFLSLADPIVDSGFQPLRDLAHTARDEFAAAGFPIQTVRVATQSLSEIAPRDLKLFATDVQTACKANGIDYASLGALPGAHPMADSLPDAIAGTETIFASMHVGSHRQGIDFRSISTAARVIRAIADAGSGGFGNLRFAALANCPPHSPFFPAAYHDGAGPAFALATEGAPLAVEAFRLAQNLDEARASLISAVEDAARGMVRVASDLAQRYAYRFAGIDFSLAPYPDPARSIGAALESLTGVAFGEHGTLFAAAFVADCLRRADYPRVGFNGLMLPVLEDATLAKRATYYSLDSLLLYSSVCGTGIDTIPLPGDTSAQALAAILLDLATLAVKLDKPLTARLLPIPGLKAGDPTHFDFEYFANARVMEASASATKVLENNAAINFKSDQT